MTTPKRPMALEPEDLSVRIRRGDSTAEERRTLEQLLGASALLRVAHRVGRDFDEAARVRPGDDELILRASSLALARPARRGRRRTALLLGMAATLAIATSAAATGYWFSKTGRDEAGAPSPGSGTAGLGRARVETERPTRTETRAENPPKREADAISRPEPVSRQRGHVGAEVASKTAAELFRDANSARRAGNFELARSLYAELLAQHPGTNEASVSRVSLGRLLLAAGRAREADQQFRSYLGSGRKNLEQEALVGRADALGRLGESGEERRVWEDLLRRHPSSVYAAHARQRLGELGAAASPETP